MWNFKGNQPVEVQLDTDASQLEWGAKLGNLETQGDWNSWVECQWSSDTELLAILLALFAFKDVLCGQHVQSLTDNVSLVFSSCNCCPFDQHRTLSNDSVADSGSGSLAWNLMQRGLSLFSHVSTNHRA